MEIRFYRGKMVHTQLYRKILPIIREDSLLEYSLRFANSESLDRTHLMMQDLSLTLALVYCSWQNEFFMGRISLPQITDIGTFETMWQVKFYNYHKRDHCQWGSPFSVIEYECKPNETRSLMWVNKESFL